MNDLQQRVIDISKKLGLTHIGSNLSCLPILEEIYAKKNPGDIVIFDNAHAHLAHLVIMEANSKLNDIAPEVLLVRHGIHCDRKAGCDASGGSLAHTGIALGYAVADRSRKVYLIVSDGSVNEGSFAEALRIANRLHLKNLEIHANFNGSTAVEDINTSYYENWIRAFGFPVIFHHTTNTQEYNGVQGHYRKV